MRKAVNYAVDRTAYGDQQARTRRSPFDQYSRRACRATRTSTSIPIIPTSSRRATSRAGIPETRCGRSPSTTARAGRQPGAGPDRQTEPDRHRLRTRPGSDWPGGEIYDRMGTRGEPFDLAVSIGLVRGLPRPVGLHLPPGRDDDPRRSGQHQLLLLQRPGLQRPDARGGRSSSATSATTPSSRSSTTSSATPRRGRPCARTTTATSSRSGSGASTTRAAYGIDLAQLCVRPEITTDDTIVYEPDSGRRSSTCRCA